jgi:uncharacterized protein YqeY
MKLYNQMKDDIIVALKNKNKPVLTCLRTLDAAILQIVKDKGKELTDDLFIDVAKKSIKDRETSKSYAFKAGRIDLIDQANKEMEIIGKYLPKTLPIEDTEKLVIEAISATGASTKKDMGKVMGYLKSGEHALDMSLTSTIVGEKLA